MRTGYQRDGLSLREPQSVSTGIPLLRNAPIFQRMHSDWENAPEAAAVPRLRHEAWNGTPRRTSCPGHAARVAGLEDLRLPRRSDCGRPVASTPLLGVG